MKEHKGCPTAPPGSVRWATLVFQGWADPCFSKTARFAVGIAALRTDQRALRGCRAVNYVPTLRHRRESFLAHAGELATLGFDDAFQRLWTLYLAYCEAGFAERRICDVQLLLAKPGCRLGDAAVSLSSAPRPRPEPAPPGGRRRGRRSVPDRPRR